MARRKFAPKENHERWLVSYADLVTLLFAFFVVMFASTQSDHTRAKQISQAVEKALKSGTTPPKLSSLLVGTTIYSAGHGNALLREPVAPARTPEPPKDLSSTLGLLRSRLQKEIAKGDVDLHAEERGIVIGLNSAVFFSLGDDTIDPRVYPTLAEVATIVNRLPNALRFEGHTDSLPISNERFRSNWELSSARSIAMLRLLVDRYKVNAARMAIVGYADTVAVDSNQTEEGRRRNRRADIVIVSDAGMRAEPHPAFPPKTSP